MTTSKIMELTPEQESQLEPYFEECLAKGLSTEVADTDTAEAAIRELYAVAGEADPQIHWVRSPLEGFMFQAEYPKLAGITVDEASVAAGAGVSPDQTLRNAIVAANADGRVVWPWYVQWGWWGAAWWRYAAFAERFIDGFDYDEEDSRALAAWNALADSCHMVWTFDGLAVLCDRPCELNLNDRGDLHCETGPAIRWDDGYAVFALQGVMLTDEQADAYITRRDSLTSEAVLAESNTEVRRVVAHYVMGWDRLLDGLDCEVLDEVPGDARLVRVHLAGDDEPMHFMDLLNHTCERCVKRIVECKCAEQSRKRYIEGVPNTILTVRAAHAWRWDVPEELVVSVGGRA